MFKEHHEQVEKQVKKARNFSHKRENRGSKYYHLRYSEVLILNALKWYNTLFISQMCLYSIKWAELLTVSGTRVLTFHMFSHPVSASRVVSAMLAVVCFDVSYSMCSCLVFVQVLWIFIFFVTPIAIIASNVCIHVFGKRGCMFKIFLAYLAYKISLRVMAYHVYPQIFSYVATKITFLYKNTLHEFSCV